MAQQEEYLQEEDVFGTDTSDIDELDEIFAINKAEATEITTATEEDRKVAKETGKAKPEAKAAEKKVLPKEEEKILGSELEDDTVEESTTQERIDKGELTEFAALSEGMFKAGIWTRDEDEDETFFPQSEEDFIERHQYEGQKLANNYIGQFAGRHGEDARQLFDAVYKDGVPIKDYVAKWQESQDFKSMDMTDEGNQERVVRTFLEQQGVPGEKITEKLKKLRLSEDLEDEANTYHSALVKRQETDLQKIEENSRKLTEQKKQRDLQYLTSIDNIYADKLKSQEFDGIPINTQTADQAKSMLKDKKWKMNDGTLITDWDRIVMDLDSPQNYEVKAKLALLIKPYQPGKPLELNLQGVEKRAVTKTAQQQFFNIPGKSKKVVVPDTKKQTAGLLDDL